MKLITSKCFKKNLVDSNDSKVSKHTYLEITRYGYFSEIFSIILENVFSRKF